MKKTHLGFTLIELLVVISIIGVLSAIVFASFGDARADSRDKVRQSSLKELALALEVYKSQNGVYPDQGCDDGSGWATPETSGCADGYIIGLVPDYISELPTDPNQEAEPNKGFMYQVSPTGDRYKAMVQGSIESNLVSSFNNEFARCPVAVSGGPCESGAPDRTYAIYSPGAENW
jgi:prepilin-type N-terminal cleavage/methylation domain-containing protein